MTEKPNLNYIQEISGGDKEFENKLLQIVKNELPNEIETYTNFLKQEKFILAAEIVHKIKHKISILGLTKSYQVAIDYEEDLKKNSIKLKNEFEIILTSMIHFINKV
ncbi:Hpt domain-containing protein [Lutibacter sp. TH_r2]|uniref:Hpt domain-containing protein n=1 Tax=Lutibacter sp. TH_r2 TaxID=3082083 RepID=UPI002955C907|nr:Hpt domain-containing protein [Lutibacter sp. TH_r2]MDV7186827.1 Hpt domain-containing protein [Lutibacter sp. TH_r2]